MTNGASSTHSSLHKHHVHPKYQHLVSKKHLHQYTENDSAAHKLYRDANPQDPAKKVQGMIPGFLTPSSTGVLYASDRAAANGWSFGDAAWSNLGQGQPETHPLPQGPQRLRSIDLDAMGDGVLEYSPTNGTTELRTAIAKHYNETYRVGKESQYTFRNVAVVPGGRAGLTRIASIVGKVYVNYQVPEYSAYSEMLSSFNTLIPVPTAIKVEDGYVLDVDKLRAKIHEQGTSVVMLSNPRNPTGQHIEGDELKKLVKIAAEDNVTVIHDEFYSWYRYSDDPEELGRSVSASEFVEDVEKESTVIVQGLTKCWRYPGFRIAWVIGPSVFITALGQCGGYLDGGACHVMQAAVLPLFDKAYVIQDRISLQLHFKAKRDHVLARLKAMGLEVKIPPTSTFYIWLSLESLPAPLNIGLVFFEECLKEKVIVVVGLGFDISPIHRANMFNSPFHHYVRLSYGPPMDEVNRGLDGIERVMQKIDNHVLGGGDIHDIANQNLVPSKKKGEAAGQQ